MMKIHRGNSQDSPLGYQQTNRRRAHIYIYRYISTILKGGIPEQVQKEFVEITRRHFAARPAKNYRFYMYILFLTPICQKKEGNIFFW